MEWALHQCLCQVTYLVRNRYRVYIIKCCSPKYDLLDVRDIRTRQFDKVKFKVFNPEIKIAFKSPKYIGAQLWDKIPITTQLSGSFAEFKCKIKKHIGEGLFNDV